MSHRSTPDDILWYVTDPEGARLFEEALEKTDEQVADSLRSKGYDLEALDSVFIQMIEDMPRHIGKRAVAKALVTAPRTAPVVCSSIAEAQPVLARIRPSMWSTWRGDETGIGVVLEAAGDVGIEWLARDIVRHRLSERRAGSDDALVKRMCAGALEAIDAPRAPGKVTLLVAAPDRILAPYVAATDLSSARSLTSFQGGTA